MTPEDLNALLDLLGQTVAQGIRPQTFSLDQMDLGPKVEPLMALLRHESDRSLDEIALALTQLPPQVRVWTEIDLTIKRQYGPEGVYLGGSKSSDLAVLACSTLRRLISNELYARSR